MVFSILYLWGASTDSTLYGSCMTQLARAMHVPSFSVRHSVMAAVAHVQGATGEEDAQRSAGSGHTDCFGVAGLCRPAHGTPAAARQRCHPYCRPLARPQAAQGLLGSPGEP